MNNEGESKPIIEVVAVAFYCKADRTFFLARRGPAESGAGEWEFPGGKVESGESREQALQREILEELGYDIVDKKLQYIAMEPLNLQTKIIHIHLFQISLENSKPHFGLVDHDEMGWFTLDQIKQLNISKADIGFISQLKFL